VARETIAAQYSKQVDAVCPAGKTVIGGGYDGFSMRLRGSHPLEARFGQGWTVKIANEESYPLSVTVWAICAAVAT
jgi:hypothetical protein